MGTVRKPIVTKAGAVFCYKCKRELGRMEQGVLVVGGIRLWGEARYSCECGRSYFYAEKLIDVDDDESPRSTTIGVAKDRKEGVMKIVNELGKEYTPAYEVQKRKAL